MLARLRAGLGGLVCLLVVVAAGGDAPAAAGAPRVAAFDCASVTEIPQPECAALVALYQSTDGAHWRASTGWLQTTTPCSWHGVTCVGGHVSKVELGHNRLNGPLPIELGNLTALDFLDLSLNYLVALSPLS